MFIRRGCAILRAPEQDPSDPGSGGGDHGDPPPAPKTLAEEDIGRIVNAAITNKLKGLNIEKKITEAIGALKIDDKFTQLTAALEGLKPSPPAGGGGGGQPDGNKSDDEIRALKKQLENLATQAERAEAARLQAEANTKQIQFEQQFNTGRQKLYESLKEHADPSLHDVWVDHLVHHKRLKIEEGIPLLEVDYSPVKGMPKQRDFLPLDEALPHLIESNEAKRFMAAPPVPGPNNNPGPKGGRRPNINPNSTDPLDRAAAALSKLGMNFDEEFSG